MEKTISKPMTNIRDICYIAIFTAIIAVMAQISIPLPAGVPLTLQTLAIPLAGIILGAKRGTMSTIVYILLAIAGVPVLANFTGGAGVVFGVTGGFIISFPIMAFLAGLVADKGIKSPWFWGGLVAGVLINYLVGTVWFMFVAEASFEAAFTACVLPFLVTGLIKLVLSGILGDRIKRALKKAGLL